MTRALMLGLGALLVTAAAVSAQSTPAAAPKATGHATVGAHVVDGNGDGIGDHSRCQAPFRSSYSP